MHKEQNPHLYLINYAIDLNPDILHYYPFVVNLDRCGENCNILDGLSDRLCVSNKTESVNLKLFNMTTGQNE